MSIDLIHHLSSVDYTGFLSAAGDIPANPPSEAPPGVAGKMGTILGWSKWAGFVACGLGLLGAFVIWALPDWVPGGDKAVAMMLKACIGAVGVGAAIGIIGVLAT